MMDIVNHVLEQLEQEWARFNLLEAKEHQEIDNTLYRINALESKLKVYLRKLKRKEV